jgi:hypothetical protein
MRKSGLLWSMVEVPKAILRVEDIPVVCHYPDVFPADLPGLPPETESIFEIKLVPGT